VARSGCGSAAAKWGQLVLGHVAERDRAGAGVAGGHHGDELPQLADVPRVVAAGEQVEDRRIEPRDRGVGPALAQEVFGQPADVARPGPERGHGDDVRDQPVVQVGAEPALPLFGRQVAVRRADQPERRPLPRVAAEPLVRPLLDHPEQLGLEGRRELADLVEEQGAVVGQRERPLAAAHRVRERAALVSEELAAAQLRDDRGAVEHDEVPLVRAGVEQVGQAGEQLLAGAGRAGQQDARVAVPGDLDQPAERPPPGRGGADQVRRDLGRAEELLDLLQPAEPGGQGVAGGVGRPAAEHVGHPEPAEAEQVGRRVSAPERDGDARPRAVGQLAGQRERAGRQPVERQHGTVERAGAVDGDADGLAAQPPGDVGAFGRPEARRVEADSKGTPSVRRRAGRSLRRRHARASCSTAVATADARK
jgi:hypothetical protein